MPLRLKENVEIVSLVPHGQILRGCVNRSWKPRSTSFEYGGHEQVDQGEGEQEGSGGHHPDCEVLNPDVDVVKGAGKSIGVDPFVDVVSVESNNLGYQDVLREQRDGERIDFDSIDDNPSRK